MYKNFINTKNIDLYNEILKITEIKLIEDTNWGSRTYDEIAEIYYKNSNFSIPCFTHELLHIKYYHLGLRFPKFESDENNDIDIICIFNQLSHHKFFDEFCSLGFHKKEFLDVETEVEANNRVESRITIFEDTHKIAGKIKPSKDLFETYLMLKSPHDDSKKTFKFLQRLKNIGDEVFFNNIDIILDDWLKSPSLNSSLTLAKIFKACNHRKVGFYIDNKDEIIYSTEV